MDMGGYTKLFSSIVTSTVWREPPAVRLVWITMLALSDKCGIVEASVPGLADMARVSRAECDEALLRLSSPDPDSRTQDHEGRRIKKVDGGWALINHAKYREKMSLEEQREKNATYMRGYRKRPQLQVGEVEHSESESSPESKASRAESPAPAEPRAKLVDQFLIFPVVGKTAEWVLTNSQIAAWKQLFPHLDVDQECRAALAWTIANPAKRKTGTGVARFLVAWLGRAQESGRGAKNVVPAKAGGPSAKPVEAPRCPPHRDREIPPHWMGRRWASPGVECCDCKHVAAKRTERHVSDDALFAEGK